MFLTQCNTQPETKSVHIPTPIYNCNEFDLPIYIINHHQILIHEILIFRKSEEIIVHKFHGWSCSNKYFLQLDLKLNRETPVTFYVFGNMIKIITHINKKRICTHIGPSKRCSYFVPVPSMAVNITLPGYTITEVNLNCFLLIRPPVQAIGKNSFSNCLKKFQCPH